jgi:hypothetical protein
MYLTVSRNNNNKKIPRLFTMDVIMTQCNNDPLVSFIHTHTPYIFILITMIYVKVPALDPPFNFESMVLFQSISCKDLINPIKLSYAARILLTTDVFIKIVCFRLSKVSKFGVSKIETLLYL